MKDAQKPFYLKPLASEIPWVRTSKRQVDRAFLEALVGRRHSEGPQRQEPDHSSDWWAGQEEARALSARGGCDRFFLDLAGPGVVGGLLRCVCLCG